MLFNKSVEVAVKDHTLVAAFHKSTPSVIWNFNLEKSSSSTIALRDAAGETELGVTSPEEAFKPVATFKSYEAAEEALAAVQKALFKTKSELGLKVYNWIRTLALLIVIFMGVTALFHRDKAKDEDDSKSTLPDMSQAAPAKQPPGVAVSADKYLQPPP